MPSNLHPLFRAPVLAMWRGAYVAVCERHARAIMSAYNLIGKVTPLAENPQDDECGMCIEEWERDEAIRQSREEDSKPKCRRSKDD